MSAIPDVGLPQMTIDGGDRSCGELLIAVRRQLAGVRPGTLVVLIATDPAGPIDIPAWCHLVGHTYLGTRPVADGRPAYAFLVTAVERRTVASLPWHLETAQPNPERTPPP